MIKYALKEIFCIYFFLEEILKRKKKYGILLIDNRKRCFLLKKRYLYSFLLAFVVVGIISYVGVAFAWYQIENTGTNVEITSEEIHVNYTSTNRISNSVGIPISDSDVNAKADKCTLVVDVEKMMDGYDYLFELSFKDIVIDEALKISDFKWEVLKNGISVATGDFSSLSSTSYLLYSEVFSFAQVNQYEVRVWLRETGVSQNDLMGKSFRAKVESASFLESK